MEINDAIVLWLLIVLATHSISHTLATQRVFKPLRDYLAPRMGDYWGELVRCPFCIAHWIALALLIITQIRINFTNYYIVDLIIIWQATVGVANYLTWILCDKIKANNAKEG
jgi:hypothetical protein